MYHFHMHAVYKQGPFGGGVAQPVTQFVPPSSGIQPAPLSLYGSTQTLYTVY